MANRVPAPSTEAGRAFIEKLRADDAGFTQLTSGRFHLGAVVTDAEDAVVAIEEAARTEGRREAVRVIEAEPFFPNGDGPSIGNAAAFRDYRRRILARLRGTEGSHR